MEDTKVVPLRVVPGGLQAGPDPRRLLEHFLSGRSRATRKAYAGDLEAFAVFLGEPSAEDAARRLIGSGPGNANALALEYKAHMMERGLSPATVNRRLAALRSVVHMARTLGFVSFALECRGVKSESYRNTAGPGKSAVALVLSKLAERKDKKGRRDYAIVRLLYDLALRRNEVVRLRLEDVDLLAGTISVIGKGRMEPEPMTLQPITVYALGAWMEVRGSEPGPLFPNMDPAHKAPGAAIDGRNVYQLVRDLGLSVGATMRPHGLRHTAITRVLERSGGNIVLAMKFSRHRKPETLMVYNDARVNLAAEAGALVVSDLED